MKSVDGFFLAFFVFNNLGVGGEGSVLRFSPSNYLTDKGKQYFLFSCCVRLSLLGLLAPCFHAGSPFVIWLLVQASTPGHSYKQISLNRLNIFIA